MMYLPPQFNSLNILHTIELIREYPLASLITTGENGFPFITHLPLHVEEEGASFILWGHVAKPNPHWKYLMNNYSSVVSFMGPQSYMSPKVYPDLVRVPTWTYLTVQCTVKADIIDSNEEKDTLLKKLIGQHEPDYAKQWRSLGKDYTEKMLSGIVGFKLNVEKYLCKLKLNQHRPESHQAMYDLYENGNDNERALATWMRKLGMVSSRDQMQP